MLEPKGIMFNGVDLSPYLYANLTKPILPEIQVNESDAGILVGARHKSVKVSPLDIEVKVRLRAKRSANIADLRHILGSVLYVEEPAPLYLGDEPNRYYMAVLSGSSELDKLWYTGSTALTFHCSDPVAYGAKHKQSVGALNVGGNRPARPIITARPGSCSVFTVTKASTGEFVRLNVSCNSSSVIVINCEDRHCFLNNSLADKYVNLASDYFDLLGRDTLTVSSGSATVEWAERWM